MRIATNSPFSFSPSSASGYEFFQLGDAINDVAMIILLLKKNWGGGHINEINALTHWISSYPKEIPCYVIGCESTIPIKNVKKYSMKSRDDAIRDLCDEVLSRSNSIGVRGEITRLYLTEVLGYKTDQVDIIYDPELPGNLERIRAYLQKNNCRLQILEKDFLDFQKRPRVFYERPCIFDKSITISRPYVTNSGSTARLNSDILNDGQIKPLWCETSETYQQFLLSERADAFLCVLLPVAMRSGKDIICEAPVTEQFLHNLNEILIPQLCAHDPRLYRTQVIAAGDSSLLFSANAVATGMSCGVDSFYTVSLYLSSKFKSMNLTHLYTGNYLYGNESKVYERAELAAEDLGLPLVQTKTNISSLRLPHLHTHFFKTMFGVLALRKLFRIYYYSSAADFSHFTLKGNATNDTAMIELLLLYAFSCSDFQVVTGGAKTERVEKTAAICSLPTAKKLLNVCLFPGNTQNCGKCGKCMRTLLMLDMLNSLDLFRAVFDIDEYRRARLENFVYLVQKKKSMMLAAVYKHFLRTEPLLMKQAEAHFSKAIAEPNLTQLDQ
jgi:hypothetical protein